jgi:hypothetical protein
MLFKGAKPVVEGLVGVDDDFEFAIGKFTDNAGILRRERYFDPLAIKTQGIGHIENTADLLKRNCVKRHAYPLVLSYVMAF